MEWSNQRHCTLPNWIFEKAIQYAQQVTGITRPVKDHSHLINAWEACFRQLTTIDQKGKFDLEKALNLSKSYIVGNPLYPKSDLFDNPGLLELMILTRALGMRDQFKIDQAMLSAEKLVRSKRGRKSKTT